MVNGATDIVYVKGLFHMDNEKDRIEKDRIKGDYFNIGMIFGAVVGLSFGFAAGYKYSLNNSDYEESRCHQGSNKEGADIKGSAPLIKAPEQHPY